MEKEWLETERKKLFVEIKDILQKTIKQNINDHLKMFSGLLQVIFLIQFDLNRIFTYEKLREKIYIWNDDLDYYARSCNNFNLMCIDHEIKSSLKKIIKLDSYVVFSKNKVDYMYKSMELYINEEFRMDTLKQATIIREHLQESESKEEKNNTESEDSFNWTMSENEEINEPETF